MNYPLSLSFGPQDPYANMLAALKARLRAKNSTRVPPQQQYGDPREEALAKQDRGEGVVYPSILDDSVRIAGRSSMEAARNKQDAGNGFYYLPLFNWGASPKASVAPTPKPPVQAVPDKINAASAYAMSPFSNLPPSYKNSNAGFAESDEGRALWKTNEDAARARDAMVQSGAMTKRQDADGNTWYKVRGKY